MNRLLFAAPAAASLLATTLLLTPQPANAVPTCRQEISIRCSGYNVQGRPRLDIYYDSYEECMENELSQCVSDPEFGALDWRKLDTRDRRAQIAA